MQIIKTSRNLIAFLEKLGLRDTGSNARVEKTVRKILDAVKGEGDKAVLRYTRTFDTPSAKKIRISPAEIARHADRADSRAVRALAVAARRIRKFHERQKDASWFYSEGETILGQILRPLRRVGVYVPGGTASYPSTVLMNVIPAQTAGVKEIAVCVPAPQGRINPYVMAAIRMLDISEVYGIGGAQAVGALAFGTKRSEERRVGKECRSRWSPYH